MTPLDIENEIIDPMNVSPWPRAIQNGLIGSAIIIGGHLLLHMTGFIEYSEGQNRGGTLPWVANILIIVASMFLAIQQHRDIDLGGSILYRRAFGVSLLSGLIISFFLGVWFYILYGFMLDPQILLDAKETMLIEMEKEDYSVEDLEQLTLAADIFYTPKVLGIIRFIANLIFCAMVALLGGSIFTNENTSNGYTN